MGIDKIKKKKKKKPNQLVSKRKDGKRPGYYGSDDYGSGEDGQGGSSSSSSDNGGGDDNYMDYYVSPAPSPAPSYDTADFAYTTPSPSPEPDTSGDDQEDDVAVMMETLGITPDNAPTDFTLPDAEDDGNNLYVTPSQTIEINPVDEFGTKGNVYADTGFTPISSPNVTYDTIASLPAPEPKGILQTIGGGLKTAAKFALPILAPAFLPASLAKGYTTYNQARNISRLANLATKGKTGTLPTLKEAFTTFQGTGNRVPDTPTGFDDNDSSNNNIITKNVVASNVKKYSPAQVNSLQKNISLLESVLDKGSYQNTRLNNSQLAQVSSQRDSLVQEYNRIQEFLV